MNKRLTAIVVGLAVVGSFLLGVGPLNQSVSATPECDDNAVVRCGIYSTDDLKKKYTGDVKAVYNHMGITDGMINGTSATIKNGTVLKNGDVVVDGKVIATGAVTVGRHNIGNSTKFTAGGSTFYQRPTTVSFTRGDVSEAYVFVDNDGKFLGAVLKPCGNPARATPKHTPPAPEPLAACESIKANKISRNQYTFTAESSTDHGATISRYSFRFDGPGAVDPIAIKSTAKTVTTDTVTFETAGQYTASVTVLTSEGNRSGANCSTRITIKDEPEEETPVKKVEVCDPSTGNVIEVDEDKADDYKPVDDPACQPKVESAKTAVTALPTTGPGDMVAGAAGLGSLTAAGYYFRASRSRLLDALRGDK